jgi:hypothetical protein
MQTIGVIETIHPRHYREVLCPVCKAIIAKIRGIQQAVIQCERCQQWFIISYRTRYTIRTLKSYETNIHIDIRKKVELW